MIRFTFAMFMAIGMLVAIPGRTFAGELLRKPQLLWPALAGYSRIKAPVASQGNKPNTYYQKGTYDWSGGRFEQIEITLARDPAFEDKYSAKALLKEKNPPKELQVNEKKAWLWEFPGVARNEVARRLVVILDSDKAIIIEQRGSGAKLDEVAKKFDFAKVQKALATEPPIIVELWPGKVPDEAGDIGAEKVRMSPMLTKKEVEVTEPTRLITNVSKPTITIYRPAKDKDNGAAVLICPGGGYWDLYWELEGEEVAAWLNSLGVTGIILKYRVPRRPDEPKGVPARRPLQDAQRAVSLVRSKATDWGIDPKRIGMVGFSAGGHLALATATGFEKRVYEPIDEIDKISCRPDFAIAAYSGYLKHKDKEELAPGLSISAKTPPIFLAHGGADIISPPEHSVVMYLALKRTGIPVEFHLYAGAAHDFAVRPGDQPCSTWTRSCAAWMRHQGFLKAPK